MSRTPLSLIIFVFKLIKQPLNMLKHGYLCLLSALLAVILGACGSDSFHVEGRIDGMARQNLRAVYYADGAIRMVPAMVIDGKFSFEGRATEPALVELYTSDRNLLGRFVAKNGETIRCGFDRRDPYNVTIDGNELSGRWADFLRVNSQVLAAGDNVRVNALVARYVEHNPSDQLSSLLLVTLYDSASDPVGAQKLLELINPDSKPVSALEGYAELLASVNDKSNRIPVRELRLYSLKDSMATYRTVGRKASMICFTTAESGRKDSIVKALKRLAKATSGTDRLILDVSLDADSVQWRQAIGKDSATWTQVWAPGSAAAASVEPLAIDRLPFFIVTDSAGNQLYRGSQLLKAETAMTNQLKK